MGLSPRGRWGARSWVVPSPSTSLSSGLPTPSHRRPHPIRRPIGAPACASAGGSDSSGALGHMRPPGPIGASPPPAPPARRPPAAARRPPPGMQPSPPLPLCAARATAEAPPPSPPARSAAPRVKPLRPPRRRAHLSPRASRIPRPAALPRLLPPPAPPRLLQHHGLSPSVSGRRPSPLGRLASPHLHVRRLRLSPPLRPPSLCPSASRFREDKRSGSPGPCAFHLAS